MVTSAKTGKFLSEEQKEIFFWVQNIKVPFEIGDCRGIIAYTDDHQG